MPKFTRTPRPRGYWIKELLLTILATSISIVLTFGTAYYLEYQQKMSSRRQMAMMIIHDIDMSIMKMGKVDSLIREFADLQLKILEGNYEGDINTAHLQLAMLDPVEVDFPETTERIFTSNVDTWSTIGKVDFIDNVSHCYLVRRQFKQKVLDAFHKKIHPDELEFNARSLDDYLDVEPDYYLSKTESAISRLKTSNALNKKIMGVSDKELQEFVEIKLNHIQAQIDSLVRVDSVNMFNSFNLDEKRNAARANFKKNRDKMYPKKSSNTDKSK